MGEKLEREKEKKNVSRIHHGRKKYLFSQEKNKLRLKILFQTKGINLNDEYNYTLRILYN